MPVIPTYEREQLAKAPTLDASALAAPGAALAQAGGALSATAADMQRRASEQQDRTDALAASKTVAQARLDWTKQLIERQQSVEDGAPGFTDGVLKDFAAYQKQTLASTSEGARPYVETRLIELQGSLAQDALMFEARARGDKQARDLGSVVNLHANTVRTDDLQFAPALAEATAAVEASGLPADERAKFLSGTRESLAVAAMQGMTERNPARARAVLKGGGFDAYLTPEQKNALINGADAELRRRQAEAERAQAEARAALQAEVKTQLEDELAAVRDRGTGIGLDPERVRAAFPKEADKIMAALGEERGFYAARQTVALNSPEEDAALLAKRAPAGEGYASEAERRDALIKAIEAKRTALDTDPAGYALAASPALRQSFAAAEKEPALLAPALALLEQTQERLGVAEGERRALSQDQAQAIVARVRTAPGEKAADAMQGLAEEYGQYWPQAYRDLVGAGLKGPYRVLATTDDPAARKTLGEALALPPEDLKRLAGDDAKTVEAAVREAMTPFRATLAAAPDGASIAADYEDAATRLAYRYAANQDPSEAARSAVEAVVDGRYDYALDDSHAARAPKGRLDAALATGARMLDGLKAEALRDPGGAPLLTPSQRQAAYLETLRRGQWVSNESDSGWLLLDALGQPALLADGSRIEFMFNEATANKPSGMSATKGGPVRIAP